MHYMPATLRSGVNVHYFRTRKGPFCGHCKSLARFLLQMFKCAGTGPPWESALWRECLQTVDFPPPSDSQGAEFRGRCWSSTTPTKRSIARSLERLMECIFAQPPHWRTKSCSSWTSRAARRASRICKKRQTNYAGRPPKSKIATTPYSSKAPNIFAPARIVSYKKRLEKNPSFGYGLAYIV